ncbi:MAG: hypothetical protein CVV37_06925 [Nitrospira bacterium HGW-Nitrospira-1]|nr:MAG: hypothetical protein CVV37_06925 [Nitrospira bacterium HGW-Nitrospira-1]
MADKTTRIKEAQKYLAKGQLGKAIAKWEKLVQEFPDGNNYNFIGDLYLKNDDKKNAVESFQKAANIFRQEGFSLKTLALFKKILNVNPADAAALYALGELSEEKELITDAIKYYLAAADSLAKEGRKGELFDIYKKILSLSPSNIPLRIKVAETLFKEGLKSDAAKEHLYIAGIYENKGDIPKAKESYRKAIGMQPLNKDAVVGLSCLYEKTGGIDEAIELMKEASVLFPEDVDVLMRAAELSLLRNSTENAKDYLSRVNELEPKNAKARRLLGEIYSKEGLKEKAVEELNLLGDIYYDRGAQKEALACYNDAIEIAPDNDYLYEQTAELGGEHKKEVPEFIESTGPAEGIEAAKDEESGRISIKAEKTVDKIFTEADIFCRYGLFSEAQALLEGLKLRVPENIDLHLRLKTIYSELDNKEAVVTECLILSGLFKRSGDTENSEKALREGYEISPSDPRLSEKGFTALIETTSRASKGFEEFSGAAAGEEGIGGDYEKELAKADFYARQGLAQEALRILLELQRLLPENRDIAERLEALGERPEISSVTETPEAKEKTEMSFEFLEGKEESPDVPSCAGETPQGKEIPEEGLEDMEYKDFPISKDEIMKATEMPKPMLGDDVLEIFQEFKEGLEPKLLEPKLDDEETEMHYNLGVAYKEMGLVDDAINEFQTVGNNKKRFLQSSSILGLCYMEKGLYSIAIDLLTRTLESARESDESYWSIKYDLAEAYEKNNNPKKALELYTEVYGWNAKFRDVSDKVGLKTTQAAKNPEKDKTTKKKSRISYL